MLKLALQPSQLWGSSGGSVPYQSTMAYLHSWGPSSVPFTVDGTMESHAPVFLPRRRRRLYVGDNLPAAAEKASSTSWSFCRLISFLSSVRSCVWSPERNSTRPRRAATRCPVTTHDAVQLPFAIWAGSGIASPACLTGNPVIVQSGMCFVAPWKRSGRNPSQSAFSTGWKSSPSPLVARCTKAHSCWRDFCRPT